MNATDIKQRLHQYIDTADEKKLQAIYTILEDEIEGMYFYSQEEISLFYERREKHITGESKSWSIEAAHDSIRHNRKSNGL